MRRAQGRDPRSSSGATSARTASTTGANEMPASMSRQWPTTTLKPSSSARRATSETSVDFPIPASPPTSTVWGLS